LPGPIAISEPQKSCAFSFKWCVFRFSWLVMPKLIVGCDADHSIGLGKVQNRPSRTGVAMRLPFVRVALLLGCAAMASTASGEPAQPFQLKRLARAASPGLHIKIVDAAGAPIYPVTVAVEYDSGASSVAETTANGVTVTLAPGRTVRAVRGGGPSPQRFDIDATRANFLMFSR
jgi:hypothetical protein